MDSDKQTKGKYVPLLKRIATEQLIFGSYFKHKFARHICEV